MSQFTAAKYFFLLLLGIIVINVCQANPSDQHFSVKRANYFCGKTLSDTLRLICNGRYNKRAGGNDFDYANLDKDSNELLLDDEPFTYYRVHYERLPGPSIVGERFKRRSRSVREECCENPCSITTLRQYCKYDN